MTSFELSDDHARLDLERVTSWLATSYWSPGVALETVRRAAAGSQIIGAYDDSGQVGYCRLVTDKATFVWLADVWVVEAARGRGAGRALVERALERSAGWGVRRVMLATKDAHGLYATYGFTPLPDARFLELRLPAG